MNEKRIIFPKNKKNPMTECVQSILLYIQTYIYLQFYSTSIYLPLMPPEFLLLIELLLSDCIKFYIWRKNMNFGCFVFYIFFQQIFMDFFPVFLFPNTFLKRILEKYCLGYINLMGVVKRAEKKDSNDRIKSSKRNKLCTIFMYFFDYISLQKSRNNIERE